MAHATQQPQQVAPPPIAPPTAYRPLSLSPPKTYKNPQQLE